jgi:hypothetical protein
MLNKVEIKKIDVCSCGCEVNFIIKAFDMELYAFAQVDKEFALTLPINEVMDLDLWLVYSFVKSTNRSDRRINNESNSIKVVGEVEKILDENSIRVKSSYTIDIDNEEDIPKSITVGTYIETAGSIMIYFPNTKYSSEELR